VLNTPIDAIEGWEPDKLLAYFDKAQEVHKITRGI
jgi:hypothetical protein